MIPTKMSVTATAAADDLRRARASIGLSQSKLSRLSKVSRFKIGAYELGAGSLTADELERVYGALRTEAERLRDAAVSASVGCVSGSTR